jgi:DNA-directed RNA polymerase specialized sigma24 family protein
MGSITGWIGDLRNGGNSAAQHLWDRYFSRLVQLARRKLQAVGHRGAAEDEEDAALSAFNSFCQGVAGGQFSRLADRDDLWRLLVVLTLRKAVDQAKRQRAKKRGGRRAAGETALSGGSSDGDVPGFDQFAGTEPTPELAAIFAEEFCRVRAELRDDSLRQVFDMRWQGYSREEIATGLGCTVRTVSRKLDLIRQSWLREEFA